MLTPEVEKLVELITASASHLTKKAGKLEDGLLFTMKLEVQHAEGVDVREVQLFPPAPKEPKEFCILSEAVDYEEGPVPDTVQFHEHSFTDHRTAQSTAEYLEYTDNSELPEDSPGYTSYYVQACGLCSADCPGRPHRAAEALAVEATTEPTTEDEEEVPEGDRFYHELEDAINNGQINDHDDFMDFQNTFERSQRRIDPSDYEDEDEDEEESQQPGQLKGIIVVGDFAEEDL